MLALLDLILELQNQGGGGRKKRDNNDIPGDHETLDRNATLASHFMMRGFLNTWDLNQGTCAQQVFCEGFFEASKMGSIGQDIAKISR